MNKPEQPPPEILAYGRRPIVEGEISEHLEIPGDAIQPIYFLTSVEEKEWAGIEVLATEEQERVKCAGDIVKKVFEHLSDKIIVGVTTDELNTAAHNFMIENKVYPSFINCNGFPKSIQTNVNEVIHSGIPDKNQLVDGDILNIFVAAFYEGFHACAARMFYIGQPSEKAVRLCEQSKRATAEAISICKNGVEYKQIGDKIQQIADENKYHIIKDIVGHGIGERFHAEPLIPHQKNSRGGIMLANQVFTIGPVFTENECDIEFWENGWTAMTSDRCLGAQWMDTVTITDEGHKVVT